MDEVRQQYGALSAEYESAYDSGYQAGLRRAAEIVRSHQGKYRTDEWHELEAILAELEKSSLMDIKGG